MPPSSKRRTRRDDKEERLLGSLAKNLGPRDVHMAVIIVSFAPFILTTVVAANLFFHGLCVHLCYSVPFLLDA